MIFLLFAFIAVAAFAAFAVDVDVCLFCFVARELIGIAPWCAHARRWVWKCEWVYLRYLPNYELGNTLLALLSY